MTAARPLILAVSGGVDSVVLLDMVVKIVRGGETATAAGDASDAAISSRADIIVAHFDHGIRGAESQNDAAFVKLLSQKYRLKCEIGRGNLTQNASEDEARQARYKFLRAVAKTHGGQLVTAHHADDMVGSVTINCLRGTGWRGLAVMNADDVYRPLARYTKNDLYDYALCHKLEYVEDATNRDMTILRNRLRAKITQLTDDTRMQLMELVAQQKHVANQIDSECTRLLRAHSDGRSTLPRYFLTMIDESVAIELLQTFFRATHQHMPRPTLRRLLVALKTAPIGAQHDIADQLVATLTRDGATIHSRR